MSLWPKMMVVLYILYSSFYMAITVMYIKVNFFYSAILEVYKSGKSTIYLYLEAKLLTFEM